MNTKLTKHYFDGEFMKFFCKYYQYPVFESTFKRLFNEEDPLEVGDVVSYELMRPVDKEMIDLIGKFSMKYDCHLILNKGQIQFAPIFSEVKQTIWVELLDNFG